MKRIYLDNNATTQIDPRIRDILVQDLHSPPSNPSSIHFFGKEAKKKLSQARHMVADFFHVQPSEVIFTSGGTEAINFLLRGFHTQNPHCHIVTSNVEHACISQTLQALEKKGAKVSYLPAGLHGVVQPHQLPIDADLLVFASVNNETGAKIDLPAFASFAEKHHIPLVIDAVCHLGKDPFTLLPGMSAAIFSGHKIHAPKGVGVALIRKTFKVTPQITGGEQEYGLRAGTENLGGILGFAYALEILKEDLPQSILRMEYLKNQLIEGLSSCLGNIVIHGAAPRICNTANIGFPQHEGESLLIQLDLKGIAVSHGSACSSGSLEPSRILLNMGVPRSLVRSSLRFSLSRFTTEEEIDLTIQAISKL